MRQINALFREVMSCPIYMFMNNYVIFLKLNIYGTHKTFNWDDTDAKIGNMW